MSQKFLDLSKKMEQLKEEMELVRNQLTESMQEIGVGNYFQDPETLIVYKVVKPQGSYVFFKDIDYVRTVAPGERAGSLSKKEAEEKGFTLK